MVIHTLAPACMHTIWQLPASDLIMQLANKLHSVLACPLSREAPAFAKEAGHGVSSPRVAITCSQSDSLPVQVEALSLTDHDR